MDKSKLDAERLTRFYWEKSTGTESEWIEAVFCDEANENELRRMMSNQFSAVLKNEEAGEKDLDHILYRIHYNINNRKASEKAGKSHDIIRWAIRIAGIILLPLLIYRGVQSHFINSSARQAWVEINAPAWTRAHFVLPDGTTGWLNSSSAVKYNLDFQKDRKVTLNGEAFFDVFKDKKRSFSVITDDVVLNVTGTRFNVAAYNNEPDVEIVLEEGSLLFNDKGTAGSYTMKPNDLVIYDKGLREFSTQVVQPQKYLAWKEGKLIFRNDPLDVICRRLGRWYNVDVEVNISSVENLRLRATFVDENLEQVLDLLKRSLPIDYKIQDGNLNSDNTWTKEKVTILPRTR